MTEKAKHTAEPWRFQKFSDGEYGVIECENPTNIVATLGNGGESNARRIVACVNACEGSSTEILESLGSDFVAPIVNLIDQRDRLLDALESIMQNRRITSVMWSDEVQANNAAIAEAKGV